MASIDKFTDITIALSDGNTVPSIEILGDRTYIDIGSGTVFRVAWESPIAYGNEIDYYKLYLMVYNSETRNYDYLFSNNINDVNEFFVTSSMLATVAASNFKLYICLEAVSKFGSAYNGRSATITTHISKGCGTYIKLIDGYPQPILKRAVAFAKLGYVALRDAEGKLLVDAENRVLYAKAARTQEVDSGWTLMQDFYLQTKDDSWRASDIRYEVLLDTDGELILDANNEPIYLL